MDLDPADKSEEEDQENQEDLEEGGGIREALIRRRNKNEAVGKEGAGNR